MTAMSTPASNSVTPGLGHNGPPAVQRVPIDSIRLYADDTRKFTDRDIKRTGRVIAHFDIPLPILVGSGNHIMDGQLLWLAAKAKGFADVPIIRAKDMSPLEERMLSTALSRIGELGKWKREKQRELFVEVVASLPELLEVTAFDIGEIDVILEEIEPIDPPGEPVVDGPAVAKLGDIFQIGGHRIGCGDATDTSFYQRLMNGAAAAAVFGDPPYGMKIAGSASTKKRREFVQGSGDMSAAELATFASRYCEALAAHVKPGGIIYLCMDWRGFGILEAAAKPVFGNLINLAVWVKDRAGMGSFLRSQHELVLIFAKPGARRRNNVELGVNGRHRTNVWEYPCAATLGKTSEEGNMLKVHSTPKPVKLVADALLDSTARADIVLDPFLGSGTTLVAADKVGRVCYGIDLDPLYIDVCIRRLQTWTGLKAVHVDSGCMFDDLAASA